jgi:hypothetical protein
MEKALDEAPIDAELRARLMVPMRQMGEMCRTRD